MSNKSQSASRAEVVRIARANPGPGTNAVLQAIDEANIQLKFAATTLQTSANLAQEHAQADTFNVVSSFQKAASEYDVAAGKLNTLMLTLAIILQGNGVEVTY